MVCVVVPGDPGGVHLLRGERAGGVESGQEPEAAAVEGGGGGGAVSRGELAAVFGGEELRSGAGRRGRGEEGVLGVVGALQVVGPGPDQAVAADERGQRAGGQAEVVAAGHVEACGEQGRIGGPGVGPDQAGGGVGVLDGAEVGDEGRGGEGRG
jgi:hypothetical protein